MIDKLAVAALKTIGGFLLAGQFLFLLGPGGIVFLVFSVLDLPNLAVGLGSLWLGIWILLVERISKVPRVQVVGGKYNRLVKLCLRADDTRLFS